MSKKIVKEKKIDFKNNKNYAIVIIVFYSFGILLIECLDISNSFRLFITNTMLGKNIYFILMLVVVFINICMILNSLTNINFIKKIKNINMKTNNKNDLQVQRDLFISYFKDPLSKYLKPIAILEIIVAVVLGAVIYFTNYFQEVIHIVNFLINVETVVAMSITYISYHRNFKIYKILKPDYEKK